MSGEQSSFMVQSVIAVAFGNPTLFPCHTKKLQGNEERDHLCKHQSTSLHFPFIFDFPYLLHLIGDSIKQRMGQVTTKWIYYGLFMGLKLGFAECIYICLKYSSYSITIQTLEMSNLLALWEFAFLTLANGLLSLIDCFCFCV